MGFLKRFVILAVAVSIIFIQSSDVYAALVAKNLRYSDSADKIRIVVDLNEDFAFEKMEDFGRRIEVRLGKGKLDKNIKDLVLTNKLVRQAKFFIVDKDQLLLDIILNEEAAYKAFLLKEPSRLVVDIEKEYDIKEGRVIEPGLEYYTRRQMTASRKLKAYWIFVDTKKFEVRPVLAKNAILSRERLKNIVQQSNAIAAVNASYFAREGWVIGNLKIDGEILGFEETMRSAFLVYPDRKSEMALLNYIGEVILPDSTKLDVKGVNRVRGNDDLVIFQSKFAQQTKTNQFGYEITVDNSGKIKEINPWGNSMVRQGEYVISAHGSMAEPLYPLKIGEKIVLKQTLGEKGDKAVHLLGAGPMLLENKKIVVYNNYEQFLPDIMNGRAPRTAVGIDAKGRVLLFVADGRSVSSSGLSLAELAQELLALGVTDAINLDGGGSSEMVIGDVIVNQPSDKQERQITVALGVFER